MPCIYKDFCNIYIFEVQNMFVDNPNFGKHHTAWIFLWGGVFVCGGDFVFGVYGFGGFG